MTCLRQWIHAASRSLVRLERSTGYQRYNSERWRFAEIGQKMVETLEPRIDSCVLHSPVFSIAAPHHVAIFSSAVLLTVRQSNLK
jgi:hypothetical protein